MIKTAKISWVLWLHIERYRTNYYRKVRGANYFEFVKFGFRVSIGMPWNIHVVKYEVLNSYGRQVEGLEKTNKEILLAPGFRIRMPKVKYILS
jgi:hypothetical protein